MAKEENAHDFNEAVEHSLGREGLRTLIDWVARFSFWVDPSVYTEIQVVFPRTRRRKPRETEGAFTDGLGVWSNQPASKAFWRACGESFASHTPTAYRNFKLCHIYDRSARDPAHFTNLANLTAFPKCFESLSEWGPIQKVLKWNSFKCYGYTGPLNEPPAEPSYYPDHWPGVRILDPVKRKAAISSLREWRATKPAYYLPRNRGAVPSNTGGIE